MPAAPTAPAPDWTDVLTDFTGLRLAVYDELLRVGSLGLNQLAGRIDTRAARAEGAMESAIRWLAAHHLVRREESGRWAFRGMTVAQRLYQERGPDAAFHFTPSPRAEAQPASPRPPARPVHVSQFLNLGDC